MRFYWSDSRSDAALASRVAEKFAIIGNRRKPLNCSLERVFVLRARCFIDGSSPVLRVIGVTRESFISVGPTSMKRGQFHLAAESFRKNETRPIRPAETRNNFLIGLWGWKGKNSVRLFVCMCVYRVWHDDNTEEGREAGFEEVEERQPENVELQEAGTPEEQRIEGASRYCGLRRISPSKFYSSILRSIIYLPRNPFKNFLNLQSSRYSLSFSNILLTCACLKVI